MTSGASPATFLVCAHPPDLSSFLLREWQAQFHVFVSRSTLLAWSGSERVSPGKLCEFVELGEQRFVFRVLARDEVTEEQVAIGLDVRIALGLGFKDRVAVRPLLGAASSIANAALVRFAVASASPGKPIPSAAAIRQQVRTMLAAINTIVSANQPLRLRHSKSIAGSAVVDLVVQHVLPIADATGTGSSDRHRGRLTTQTEIVLVLPDGRVDCEVLASDGSTTSESVGPGLAPAATFRSDFDFQKLGVGGLDDELREIFRRAFASRMYPPSVVRRYGVQHERGLLLHGPPGCGKTLTARKIGQLLQCARVDIVNGPELFNKYVGESEAAVRRLFEPARLAAEADPEGGGGLFLIVFDELDAIGATRADSSSDGGARNGTTLQLLTMLDGIRACNNVLVIGLTNRLQAIDPALRRPGRFSVAIYIGLPDERGRHDILRIHTTALRENHLGCSDEELLELANLTQNFTGAELEGLVRDAVSRALARGIDGRDPTKTPPPDKDNSDNTNNKDAMRVTRQDLLAALADARPAYGAPDLELRSRMPEGVLMHPACQTLLQTCASMLSDAFAGAGENAPVPAANGTKFALCLAGERGSGRTTLACRVALDGAFPFVRYFSYATTVGQGATQRVRALNALFEEAYRSERSCLVLDDLEQLIDYSPLGQHYSNDAVQALAALLRAPPPAGRRLVIVCTTCELALLRRLRLTASFDALLSVPMPSVADVAPAIVARFCETSGERDGRDPNWDFLVTTVSSSDLVPIRRLLLAYRMVCNARRRGGDTQAVLSQLTQRVRTLLNVDKHETESDEYNSN
ncbi:AAA family ATPase [uncultured virus]|nr:AAA family ATPase [uncultured virus]